MGLTATYDPVLSRIRLSANLLGVNATHAIVWRSTDNFATFTVIRGANPAPVSGAVLLIDDYEFEPGVPLGYQIASYNAAEMLQASWSTSITQDLDEVWLKVPAAPFLNRPVTVADRGEVTRRARGGLFDVVGRSNPVWVGDVASSIAYTLTLQTETPAEESDLDYTFASGEVVFLHVPSTVDYLQGGYFAVGDTSRAPVSMVSTMRRWTVPLTQVAAPGPAVVGSAYTWTSTIAEYATWTAVIADNATWADLLERTGTPSDVIVP